MNLFLGVDQQHGHWTTGLATAFLQHALDSGDDESHADITSVRGYLHTIWRQRLRGAGPYVAASLGAGRARVETFRELRFLGQEADAQHWAHDMSLGVAMGHVFAPGAWRIQPFVQLTGLYLHENSVAEQNAGAMNLDIDASDGTSLRSTLGLRAGRSISLASATLFPEARLQWTHAMNSDAADHIRARFESFGPAFEIDSNPTRDTLLLGVGLTLAAQNLSGGMMYEYRMNDHGNGEDHQLGIQLGYRF